jgi:cytochrome c553
MRTRTLIRTVAAALCAVVVLTVLGGAAFVYSGTYNVAATDPHWRLTHWLIETGRMRSIQVHATGITTPSGLDDRQRILVGTEHFAAHCAVCHGAPGVPRGDIANGLYPSPPDLAKAARLYTSAELFWIAKNGIKSTGMPAWSDHTDDELWATVAFMRKLPSMSEDDYRGLVMENMMRGSSHHHGGEAPIPDSARENQSSVSGAAADKPEAHQH